MTEELIKSAAALLCDDDPKCRTKGVRRLVGLCCIDKRAVEVARTEGVLDHVFALVKSDDLKKEGDGALVLLSIFEGAREELTGRADFHPAVAKLTGSQNVFSQSVGMELRRVLSEGGLGPTLLPLMPSSPEPK